MDTRELTYNIFSFAPESVDFLVDGIDRVSGSGGVYIVEVDSCRTETGGLPPYDSTMTGLYYDTSNLDLNWSSTNTLIVDEPEDENEFER